MLAHDPWHASRVLDSTVDVEKRRRIIGTRLAVSPLGSKIERLRELLVGESQRQSDARSSSQASWDSVFGDHHFDLYSWERAAGKARSKVWYVSMSPVGRAGDSRTPRRPCRSRRTQSPLLASGVFLAAQDICQLGFRPKRHPAMQYHSLSAR